MSETGVHFWKPGWVPAPDDEWREKQRGLPWLVWRIWRVRRSERERELGILSQHGKHVALHVLRSKRAIREFLTAA